MNENMIGDKIMQKTNAIIVLVLLILGLGPQAQEGSPGEKSRPVYKAPGGKVYPAHWMETAPCAARKAHQLHLGQAENGQSRMARS